MTAPDTTGEDTLIQPLCSVFRRFLKREGLKFTTERAQILDAVLAKEGVFSADELLDDMRDGDHRVSKATIYRTLKHLLEAKIISEVLIDSKHAHYELSFGREPKGHLVCLETDKVIEFTAPELEELRDRICKENGYEPLSFRFVVYGASPEARDVEDE
ncbi:MAG: transcriptional repressor [Phycisphaeraceae bacterium]|nr:transcriptional repressor [Phycisphaeraceae bacterium]